MPDNHNEELDTYTIPPELYRGGNPVWRNTKAAQLAGGGSVPSGGRPASAAAASVLDNAGYPSVFDSPASEPDRADRRIGRKPVLLYLSAFSASSKSGG